MDLNTTVSVHSQHGRYLYRVHRAEALRMLETHQATPHPDLPRRMIVLTAGTGDVRACRTFTGRRYIKLERVAQTVRIYQHCPIYAEDRPLFGAVVPVKF